MAIKRTHVTIATSLELPRRPRVYLPTQGELSGAIIRLMEELARGRREIDPSSVNESQEELYNHAEKSIMTANSALVAARFSVICRQWRRTQSRAKGNIVEEYDEKLQVARREDLDVERPKLLKAISKAQDGEKTALEKELSDLLLRDARPGRPIKAGETALGYLTNAMIWWFRPPNDSTPMQDLPGLIEEHFRFFDWLGRNILFNEEEKAAYAQAKEQDKAQRAADAASPAPEADAEEEEQGEEEQEIEAPAAAAS